MRSQARWDHRPPDPVDPPDDWVNGSWTVDCVCGVNFDDGEEMVNCDECGVWVHTRCSRYVKSEKSFACDKCKSSKNKRDCENDRIEEEAETEVAQLLVEMPTKTLRRSLGNPVATHEFRRRLWTQRPKEERVHVQGIPGGDVGIFCGSGLSSVFGAELWKASGYVPKKFNFQYKEFDCWNEGNEKLANNRDANAEGLPLLKNKSGVPTNFVSFDAGKQTQGEESKKKKEDLDVRSTQQNGMKKKDVSSIHSTMIHYGKRKKEDSQTSTDVSGKKKARGVLVEGDDSKKRSPHTSRSASTPSSDAKHSEFYEDRGFKVNENVFQSGKHEKTKGNVLAEPSSIEGDEVDDTKNALAFRGRTPETSRVVSTHRISLKARPEGEYNGLTATFQNSSRISDCVQSLLDHNESQCLPAKTEDVVALNKPNDCGGCVIGSDRIKKKHPAEYRETIAPRVKDSHNDYGSNDKMSLSCSERDKAQVDINDSAGVFHHQSPPPCNGKLDGAGHAPLPQHNDYHLDVIKKAASINDVQSVDRILEDVHKYTVAADCQVDKGAPSEPILFQINGQLVGSDISRVVRGNSLELKQVGHSEEPSESCETTLISSEQLSKGKMVVSFGKLTSTTATTSLSKTTSDDSRRTLDAQNYNCITQRNVVSEHKTSSKNESSAGGFVKDREKYEKSKKIAKEVPKSFTSSVKTSNLSKIPGSCTSTKTLSEPKESISFSSAKLSLLQNISSNPMSGESDSSLQHGSASYIGNKTTTSGLVQRCESVNHINLQPSSNVNHTPQVHHSAAPNAHATLSDEELALLLHHELNSSPRVPRVPRMRHAGSLPQLASPTGANMLMKRSSSSSVGKDHGLVFKRKGKSIAKEGIENSQELHDESRNMKRSPLLPVQRTNDSARTADSVAKKEVDYGSAAGEQSVNKSIPRATSSKAGNASLASAEASERNVSSTCKSPRNASDDDTGTDVRPIHRTLPGLLSEIMTKRMTYEELCNAVLPHWPHLRKHNGERYAYSSHSQAVLDCLRNRSEWARLVDRGPKTNAGRKRRRSDVETTTSFESEDNENNKKNAKFADCKNVAESRQDRFPKGKRKARKRRRRLALQGRGLKNVVNRRGRKQKEAGDVSYDEDCSHSSSSSAEESMFSDDDTIQGGGGTSLAAGRSDASPSE